MTRPDDEDNCTNQPKTLVKLGLSEIGLLGIKFEQDYTLATRYCKCSNNSLGTATHSHLNLTCQAHQEVNCVHFILIYCIAYRRQDRFHVRS